MSNSFEWDSEVPTEEEVERRTKEVEGRPSYSQKQIQLSEEVSVHPNYEVLDEIIEESDDLDDSEFLTNARLRLEQGRLYEMFLKHNLFGDIDSDPKAISNVQKELKGFIQERLEVLLGLRPDPKLVRAQVERSLPFSSLEIDILKKVIGRISGGATEQPEARTPTSPKSDSLKTLSPPRLASIKPVQEAVKKNTATRVSQPPKASPERKAAPIETPSERPDKPFSEWTAEEKEERNKQLIIEQRSKKAPPTKRHVPMPSFEQQVLHYGQRSNGFASSGLVGRILQNINKGE